MNWEEAARQSWIDCGSYIDWEERFFLCPECREPIYEADYPQIEKHKCPVCGGYLDGDCVEEEEDDDEIEE
jgi:predicted RNA-binding Zn-ribbon protein involved in translation (DUF1610 family)